VCLKIDFGCPVLVSAVKNNEVSVPVLSIYHPVICMQTPTNTAKKLREWPSTTKIRKLKKKIGWRGPQKHDSVSRYIYFFVLRKY
jgi:hypothetical protein